MIHLILQLKKPTTTSIYTSLDIATHVIILESKHLKYQFNLSSSSYLFHYNRRCENETYQLETKYTANVLKIHISSTSVIYMKVMYLHISMVMYVNIYIIPPYKIIQNKKRASDKNNYQDIDATIISIPLATILCNHRLPIWNNNIIKASGHYIKSKSEVGKEFKLSKLAFL